MLYWTEYKGHQVTIDGKKEKFDTTIYTFDIETSSYFILNNKIFPAIEYDNLSEKDKDESEFNSCMYIWMFSINDVVYYGRTWLEFCLFLDELEKNSREKKFVFVHNLSFEFQYLKSVLNFKEVFARKSHKVMKASLLDYNIEFRCTYFMTNVSLEKLASVYQLNVKKQVGSLDYNLIRHSKTPLTKKELKYCEYDCLVVYEFIKTQIDIYGNIKKIPYTSTGVIRRELKERIRKNYDYKYKMKKTIDTDPHVYNLLNECYAGGYTHANWLYSDEIVKDVSSFDFTSSYPYVLLTHRYPARKFRKCNIKKLDDILDNFAYIIVIKLYNVKSKYFNTFISSSKCREISGASYDNGRILKADYIEICVTDVDLKLIFDTYNIESYDIIESYYSIYDYLHIDFLRFILEKYINKTQYKNVAGKELEYYLEKSKFNSLYGMAVTNNIRDDVIYDNESGTWQEQPITNEKIIELLQKEEDNSFLAYSMGVWCTAYARSNLIRNVIKLDEFCVYCDTDSMKLKKGFDKKVIDNYNDFVVKKIKYVSNKFNIPFEYFAPKDKDGNPHLIGVFENDENYDEFITQGAKKYCYTQIKKNKKIKDDDNVIEKIDDEKSKVLKITVAGVPKKGCKALKSIDEFRDDFEFKYKFTGKKLIAYTENQKPIILTDYLGIKSKVLDISGCAIFPTSYVLGKALEYTNLLNENSSERAKFIEEVENE